MQAPVFPFEIAGRSWGFLDDPPPYCHLATLDRQHVVWLEDAGDRIWVPELVVPPSVLEEVHPWMQRHRAEVEEAWVSEVMIPMGWLSIGAWSENQVLLVGYGGTPNVFGVFAEVGMTEERGIPDVLFGRGGSRVSSPPGSAFHHLLKRLRWCP